MEWKRVTDVCIFYKHYKKVHCEKQREVKKHHLKTQKNLTWFSEINLIRVEHGAQYKTEDIPHKISEIGKKKESRKKQKKQNLQNRTHDEAKVPIMTLFLCWQLYMLIMYLNGD